MVCLKRKGALDNGLKFYDEKVVSTDLGPSFLYGGEKLEGLCFLKKLAQKNGKKGMITLVPDPLIKSLNLFMTSFFSLGVLELGFG